MLSSARHRPEHPRRPWGVGRRFRHSIHSFRSDPLIGSVADRRSGTHTYIVGVPLGRSTAEPITGPLGNCALRIEHGRACLLYTSPSPRDAHES
eukprot:7056488-Prymnesium_polylepis.1